MKELITHIARALVDNSDAVEALYWNCGLQKKILGRSLVKKEEQPRLCGLFCPAHLQRNRKESSWKL